MKPINLLVSLLLISLLGCDPSGSEERPEDNPENIILVNAAGVTGSVFLVEENSNTSIEITKDGVFEIELPVNQKLYQLKILSSPGQMCRLENPLSILCEAGAFCPTDYNPVCGKAPFAGVQCITSPCETDRYQTFSNACNANVNYAPIVFLSTCQGLEELQVFSYSPALVRDLYLMDFNPDPYQIVASSIEQDSITISFELVGGCGNHQFMFYVNSSLELSDPVQINYFLDYQSDDSCSETTQIQRTFDLLPIKEIFRRANPNASGDQTVELEGLGNLGSYSFTLE